MSITPHKILLIEDDLSMGFLLTEFLEDQGFEVKLCRDGESGYNALKRQQYDVCLLDVMMPKMDGFTLASHCKELNPNMPFLFITARSLKEDKLKGFELERRITLQNHLMKMNCFVASRYYYVVSHHKFSHHKYRNLRLVPTFLIIPDKNYVIKMKHGD
jgi:CheY-like chemotaxis protein